MKQITKEQRYTIFSLKKQGCTQKFIAEAIGVHKSTISRELRRNVTEKGNYSYKVAQELADIRKTSFKRKKKIYPRGKKSYRTLYARKTMVSRTNSWLL